MNKIIYIIVTCLVFTSCKKEKLVLENTHKIDPSVTQLWDKFIEKHPNNSQKELPLSFYFCDNKKDADECGELVVKGIKQATATSLWWFEKNNEELPNIGDQYIVTNWDGKALAVIEVTKIEQTPYNEITADFAKTEGEGDKSLVYWKKVHKAYYSREMAPYNESFSEDMIIVCEYFKTIYTQ